MRESHLRSVIKSVSWRLFGTFVTMFVTWMVTRQINLALYVGLFEFFAKVGFFYLHERLWGAIRFGVISHMPSALSQSPSIATRRALLSRITSLLNKVLRAYRAPFLIARPSTIRQSVLVSQTTITGLQTELSQCQTERAEAQAELSRYQVFFGKFPAVDPAKQGPDFPSVVVVSMPKSGTIYTTQLLSKGLGYAVYPLLTAIPSVESFKMFEGGGVLAAQHLHGCLPVLERLKKYVKKWIVQIRDPRAVVLSMVHHIDYYVQTDQLYNIEDWFTIRDELDKYLTCSLSEKVDWAIKSVLPNVVDWLERWLSAIDPQKYDILLTTFDELADDEEAFVRKVLHFYGMPADHFSASSLARDMATTHFRAGKKDEWCSVFSLQQIEACNRAIGPSILKRFGWDALGQRAEEPRVPQAVLVVE